MRLEVPRISVGIDLVRVSRVAESVARFGDRFLHRVFTEGEIAYANTSPALASERLAARFAAKEAAIKALDLAELGVTWRSIEVEREPRGKCRLVLHGPARKAADAAGVNELSISLSHEGDYATAVVLAIRQKELGA
jgi:holo-[acyl-carrier protein] synthase